MSVFDTLKKAAVLLTVIEKIAKIVLIFMG